MHAENGRSANRGAYVQLGCWCPGLTLACVGPNHTEALVSNRRWSPLEGVVGAAARGELVGAGRQVPAGL